MRAYYFTTDCDIGSSGVENWTLKEVRGLIDLDWPELDAIVFRDSETLGAPAVRAAVAQAFGSGDESYVMVTHGSSEANFLVMTTLLSPGDEVVVPTPRYPQLATVAEMAGCKVVPWPLRMEHGFVPFLDDAERLIGPNTRMVVANFPHNPTGASMTVKDQTALIELCDRVGAYLVWDAAFTPLVYDDPPLPDPTLRYDRAISLGTLSKAFGLPGLRVGWCIAAHNVLGRMIQLRDHLTLHLSPLIELVAARVISHAERFLAPRLDQARRNRQVVSDWVSASNGRAAWTLPRGGVCGAVQFPGVADIERLCHHVAREHRTLIVPGTCFGDPRWVRIGFGGPTAGLQEGLRRLSLALDEIERS